MAWDQLPCEVLRVVESFLRNDLRTLFICRKTFDIPDLFWKQASSRLYRDKLALVKAKYRSFAIHFGEKVLPGLCAGCGATNKCRRHLILADIYVCNTCCESRELGVLSMTRACEEYLLKRCQLPPTGVQVHTLYLKGTFYMREWIRRAAVEVHGSEDAIQQMKDRQLHARAERKRRIEENRPIREAREEAKRLRRGSAALKRVQMLPEELHSAYAGYTRDYILGDFLTNTRLRPKTTLGEVLRRYNTVKELQESTPRCDWGFITVALERNTSVEDVKGPTLVCACGNAAAHACPHRLCRKCCTLATCERHRRK